jgi:hypothetical protein
VLGHIAALAVLCRESDPRAAAINQATPLLERRRSALGLPVVSIGPERGTSVAVAALRTAQRVCYYLGTNFGCGRLIGMVLNVSQGFEPVVESRVNMAVIWAIHGRIPELAQASGNRCELSRRLLSYDADEWLTPIEMPSICRWIRELFGRVDWYALREALRLELAGGAPTPGTSNRPPKLSVDVASCSVTLLGRPFQGLDPDAVRVLEVIAKAAPNRISREQVDRQTGWNRPERALGRLPPELRALVHSGHGIRGYLLVLPACREEVES